MAYLISRDSEYPLVLITLSGDVAETSISPMLLECVGHLQEIEGLASLVIDFTNVSTIAAEKFAQALKIFYRTSATIKRDAPLFYAFVGNNGALHRTSAYLEGMKFQVPLFKSTQEAISYLNLRVSSTYLKATTRRSVTEELETLHMKSHFNGAMMSDIRKRGNSIFPTGGVLRMEALDTKQTILVLPKDKSVIGRQDSAHRKPEIDLSMWGAYHKGVSRAHAQLIWGEDNALHLVDLNSFNGTWLNGERLKPDCPYLLRDGDEATFGSLTTRLYYQETIELS